MITDEFSFSNDNLKRLFQLNVIDHMKIPFLHDACAFLPFSAPVKSLDYRIYADILSKAEFPSVNILTNKLSLVLNHDDGTFPTEYMLALLRCVADLGHFEELRFVILLDDEDWDAPVPPWFVEELIRAVHANGKLKSLHLSASEKN